MNSDSNLFFIVVANIEVRQQLYALLKDCTPFIQLCSTYYFLKKYIKDATW